MALPTHTCHSGGREAATRNPEITYMEIPGSCFAWPGMTVG